jgi:hypothetical protein
MTTYLKTWREAKDCKYPVIPGKPGVSSSDLPFFHNLKFFNHARNEDERRGLRAEKENPYEGHAKADHRRTAGNLSAPYASLHLFRCWNRLLIGKDAPNGFSGLHSGPVQCATALIPGGITGRHTCKVAISSTDIDPGSVHIAEPYKSRLLSWNRRTKN